MIGLAANLSVLLSTMLYPFMPAVSKQIREQSRVEKALMLPKRFIQFLKPGHVIGSVSLYTLLLCYPTVQKLGEILAFCQNSVSQNRIEQLFGRRSLLAKLRECPCALVELTKLMQSYGSSLLPAVIRSFAQRICKVSKK